MDELRIPKRRVAVEFQLLARPEPVSLFVFLGEHAADHPGEERLSDLLNGPNDFVPALDPSGDRMLFLQRASIVWARVTQSEEPGDEASEHTIPTEHSVRLGLLDGSSLEGLISYVLPPDRSRLNDFLNTAPSFVRLLETNRVALINRRHLVQVEAAS